MTTYKQGQVVLVPFPFTDLTGHKKRPALVVSAPWYNSSRADCVLVAITSALPAKLLEDDLVVKGREAQEAGLWKESVVRAGYIFTIQQSLIVKQVGSLPRAVVQKVVANIARVLGAPSASS